MIKQLEYIEWEDVVSSGADWYEKDDKEKWADDMSGTFLVQQCGFVIQETDKYILLCSHYHPDTEIVPEQWGHLQKIIKSLIRKRKKIKI